MLITFEFEFQRDSVIDYLFKISNWIRKKFYIFQMRAFYVILIFCIFKLIKHLPSLSFRELISGINIFFIR